MFFPINPLIAGKVAANIRRIGWEHSFHTLFQRNKKTLASTNMFQPLFSYGFPRLLQGSTTTATTATTPLRPGGLHLFALLPRAGTDLRGHQLVTWHRWQWKLNRKGNARCLMVFDGVWWCLIVFNGVEWCFLLVSFISVWWCLMVFDGV